MIRKTVLAFAVWVGLFAAAPGPVSAANFGAAASLPSALGETATEVRWHWRHRYWRNRHHWRHRHWHHHRHWRHRWSHRRQWHRRWSYHRHRRHDAYRRAHLSHRPARRMIFRSGATTPAAGPDAGGAKPAAGPQLY